jgi:hypothetical protein
MRLFPIVLAAALSIPGAAALPNASHAALKCQPGNPVLFPKAPPFVYVLDGIAADSATLARADKKSVYSVRIVCPDELHRLFGVEASRSGVVITTFARVKASLELPLQSFDSLLR